MALRALRGSMNASRECTNFTLDEKMEEIKGPAEAEAKARGFVKDRHPRLTQIFFRRTHRERDTWLVEGEVWFKRVYLFTARKSFRLQMSAETGKVTSYKEE